MKKLSLLGALSIITAAIFWSADGIFLRPHLYTLPSSLVVFWEHFLGFIVLSPALWVYRQELKLITRRQWLAVFWIALFGGALGTAFITKAFFLTNFQDLSVVLLLQKLQPIFAIVLAMIFLQEKFRRQFYLWAVLAIGGGYLVTFKDLAPTFNLNDKSWLVALFAIAAAFSFGSSTTFGKYAIKTINYKLLAALRFGLTTVIMFFAVLYFRVMALPAGQQWLILTIIVFTTGATAMFLYYYGLKKVTASQATLYELAFPISAVILDYFINHNVLSWSQLLGAAVLVFAVYRIIRLEPIYPLLTGKVITGAGLGKKLGFPTANLNPELAAELTTGLYAATVTVANANYPALLYYGYNYLQNKLSLEALIQNFSGEIHGQTITVAIDHKLRETKKFKDEADAIAAIKQDLK
ncbi:MAG: EamA family transporter [Patescibacteria group bacterium]|jgi:drug/metabolite transporter (DMT)-like permease